jgi:hypothetical protein
MCLLLVFIWLRLDWWWALNEYVSIFGLHEVCALLHGVGSVEEFFAFLQMLFNYITERVLRPWVLFQ